MPGPNAGNATIPLDALARLRDYQIGLNLIEVQKAAAAAQAQLLIGLLLQQQGDTDGARQQFDRTRRGFFGQPEALAATVFHVLGIPLDREIRDALGKPLPLCTGKPVLGLF